MKKSVTTASLVTSIRKSWGNVNPVQRAFKSKKAYNRRDKSWKNED